MKKTREFTDMSTFEFLRRLCCEEYAYTLEEKGYKQAVDWQHFRKKEIENDLNIRDKQHQARICAVLDEQDKREDLKFGFTCPDKPGIVNMFKKVYPEAAIKQAVHFATKICDTTNHGLVSRFQIQAHFKRHDNAKAAVDTAMEELIEIHRDPPPKPEPVPERTDFVYSFLKENNLSHCLEFFDNQGIVDKEDVINPQLLTMTDLADILKIPKYADRRKLVRLLEKI